MFDTADDESDEVNGDKVENSGGEHWDDVARHVLAGADVFRGHVEIVEANHADDGGFLDDGGDFVAEGGDDVFDGLRGDDFAENGEV